MKMKTFARRSTIIFTILFSLGSVSTDVPGQEPAKQWKEFVSRFGGYVAYFPESWQVLVPGAPTLEVVNFPPSQRVRAVVLPDGGASISISTAPVGTTKIDQWISHDFRFGEQQSKNQRILRRAASKQQLQVIEVVWHEDSTGVVMEGVDCYFEISKHLFLGRLEYWKGDRSAMQYRAMLHQIVERTRLIKEAKLQFGKN
jgi:hypothetical protein